MKPFAAFVGVVGVLATCGFVRADVRAEMMEASEKVQARMGDAGALLAEGKIDQINKTILATFTENSRTAVQALVLGNALFRGDPKASYALHKRAAAELPDEPMAQLEWAMEQHRAGEFDGAGKAYEKFVAANPQFGPALGMWSECLIRTGKVKEATETWIRSEQGGGSLEQFESWVCEVHNHRVPDRERADLIKKVAAGDAVAGVQLVALDCNFERDWWNRGPQEGYLKKDLEFLNDAKFPNTAATREARCAAECGIIQASGEGNVRTVLRKYGLLVDEKATLPSEDALLAPLFAAALDHGLSQADARQKFGQRVLDRAKVSRNAEVYNVAAHLYLETDKLPEIDQAGWDATGDPRFAASLLAGLIAKDALKLDDPRLANALIQFPQDAQIRQVEVVLAQKSGKLTTEMLVDAIKAEFTHFSVGGILEGRPSAKALRVYYAELSKQLKVRAR
jgi:tetratricopeptide (TPR) repeat protein